MVKRETAPTSDSAQFILAWRSEDSVESVGSSQSEAQPGSGCNAIPGAAQSGGSKKPGARAITSIDETMRDRRWRGGDDTREKCGEKKLGVRRSEGEVNELSTGGCTERYYEESFFWGGIFFFLNRRKIEIKLWRVPLGKVGFAV